MPILAKLIKSVLALGLAALMLFACAACNGGKPEPTTAPETEITTTEPETLDVVMTTGEDDTSEEPTTVDTTTTEEPSTVPGETTTIAPTTVAGKPATKAEIIAYINTMMNKVRAEKPGYTFTERTVIDDSRISSSSGLINTVAPPAIRMAKGLWSNWTDPSVKAKGADHNGVHPKVDLTDKMIKSATCTESGGVYTIRVYFIDEHVPELPVDEKSTMHGRVMSAMEKGGIEDGVSKIPGLTMNKFDILYSGSYIEMTIDKATGMPKKINSYVDMYVNMEAKLGFNVDAAIPIGGDRVFTF